jgi:hypothetical protein
MNDTLYMAERAKARSRAELLMPWLSEDLKDEWAHKMAMLRSSDTHLLGGKVWSRGPTVLK